MESLDTILSRGGEATPAPETEKQEATTQAVEQTAGQTTEQTAETTETEQQAGDGKQAPIGAIRQAEREKTAKRYTEQIADYEKRLLEREQAWERRFGQLLETVKTKAEPKPAPDIFENAPGAILHTVEPHLNEMRQVLIANSRLIAESRHTDELVNAAEAAFSRAYQTGQIDPADAQKVLGSANIYDAAVRWHKSALAKQEIGDDPAAFRAKVEAEVRAKLEAEHGQLETTGVQQRVMPSNLASARNVGSRSGPAWGGPQATESIFATNRAARGVR